MTGKEDNLRVWKGTERVVKNPRTNQKLNKVVWCNRNLQAGEEKWEWMRTKYKTIRIGSSTMKVNTIKNKVWC